MSDAHQRCEEDEDELTVWTKRERDSNLLSSSWVFYAVVKKLGVFALKLCLKHVVFIGFVCFAAGCWLKNLHPIVFMHIFCEKAQPVLIHMV